MPEMRYGLTVSQRTAVDVDKYTHMLSVAFLQLSQKERLGSNSFSLFSVELLLMPEATWSVHSWEHKTLQFVGLSTAGEVGV